MYDLVIRGGTLFDGTGNAAVVADVAILGDRIAAVGTVHERGAREIDATGLIVTPGWVDIHTHYDGQITWTSRMDPSSTLGVTTVVVGNCGVGFAPVRPQDRDMLRDRGVIAEGYLADLNIIDFDRLELGKPYMAYDLPTGARRLMQDADGYIATIKSGQIIYAEGKPTTSLPGKLIRGRTPAPEPTRQPIAA